MLFIEQKRHIYFCSEKSARVNLILRGVRVTTQNSVQKASERSFLHHILHCARTATIGYGSWYEEQIVTMRKTIYDC